MCLGIESTAHTFGASLVDDRDRIVTNVNSTYRPPVGVGIHPRKASEHLASVADSIVKTALSTKDGSSIDPDVIAYAAGPGLGPCLRIGATVARALSSFLKRPLVPVHHGVAHLDIAMSITEAHDPLAVLVSGGHTSILVHVRKRWRVYGETQDITLGNLLDMFAREAKLPSPGGLSVSREATKGENLIKLPYTVKGNDVAYSGLLTAAATLWRRQGNLADLCFSLHQTALSPQDGVWMRWMFHGYLEPSIDTSPQRSGSRPITRHCGPLEGCGQTACQKRLQKSIARRTD